LPFYEFSILTTASAQFPYFTQRTEMNPPTTLLSEIASQTPKEPYPKVKVRK
jgi:hypothetical protein